MGQPSIDFGHNRRPFIAGFMRGYRAWRMDPRELLLRPVSHRDECWIPGRNVARCLRLEQFRAQPRDITNVLASMQVLCPCGSEECGGDGARKARQTRLEKLERHQVPSINEDPCNQCGFYGLHTPNFSNEAISPYMMDVNIPSIVLGSMKATGIIVVGEKGFRAQIGEVEALAGGAVSEPYAKKYGVPNFGSFHELVREFPPTEEGGAIEPAEPKDQQAADLIPNGWMSYSGAWSNWLTPPAPMRWQRWQTLAEEFIDQRKWKRGRYSP